MKRDDEEILAQLDERFREIMKMRRTGELEPALEQLRDLLGHYEDGGYTERSAMVRINLAQVLQQRGDLEDAVTAYRQALLSAEDLDDRRRVGLCLGGLATIEMERGHPAQAEDLTRQALSEFEALDDSVGQANQLGNLGLIRQSAGHLDEALTYLTRAAQLFLETNNARGAIGVLQAVGEVHRQQGEYDLAEDAHQKALDIAQQVSDLRAQAHSHRAIGQVSRVKGKLDEALEAVEKGLDLHRRIGDLRGSLAGLIDLGTVEFSLGRAPEAIAHLDRCIERAREHELVTPLAKALLNRALYRLDTDHLEQVRSDLAEAAQHLDQLGSPMAWNIWAITSARILIREGRWDEAVEKLEEEHNRTVHADLVGVQPAILGLLASVAGTRGETQRSIDLFRESEILYRALGDVEGARQALLGQARTLAETGALEQSLTALDQLWEQVQEGPRQPVLWGEILLGRASVRNLREEREPALEDLQEAITLFQEAQFQLTELGSRLLQEQIRLDKQRLQDTSPSDAQRERTEELLSSCRPLQCSTLEIIASCVHGECLRQAGRRTEARHLVEEALQWASSLEFPDGEVRALEVLARLDQDPEQAKRAVGILEGMHCQVRADRLRREFPSSS